jgi:phosphomannomutase
VKQQLMAGVSGVRGVVGEGLTPEVLLRYSAVFASTLGPGPVVLGRDSRPTGEALRHAVLAGLLGAGRTVLDVGIVPTPTVQLEVERHRAAGGIALTASHNPVEWNALKFVGPAGRFLSPAEAAAFLARVGDPPGWSRWDGVGSLRPVHDAIEHHVERILELDEVRPLREGKPRLRVIVDAVHGAGGAVARLLLERLGLDPTVLFEEPTGLFPRPPEPLAENLGILAGEVRRQGADLGMAFDPDVDRLSLVDETGRALGEECTLALAADHVLSVKPGPVVTNLSTSARLDAVAARHGATVIRTPVGEANVVEGIIEAGARIGGEGNGGVILPALHLGRDAPAALALVLAGMAAGKTSLGAWAATLPDLHMVKVKLPLAGEPDWDAVKRAMLGVIPEGREDRRDGLWMGGKGEWVHLRKSGTEPILRVIAEGATPERAAALAEAARGGLGIRS